MKHTPGPWKAVFRPVADKWDIRAHDGQLFLFESYGFESSSEEKANAKLIASTPDLLEALQSLLKIADQYNMETSEDWAPYMEQAETAINKATN